MRSICSRKCTGHTSWLSTTAPKAILVTSLSFKFGIQILPIKWYKNEEKIVNMIVVSTRASQIEASNKLSFSSHAYIQSLWSSACICITNFHHWSQQLFHVIQSASPAFGQHVQGWEGYCLRPVMFEGRYVPLKTSKEVCGMLGSYPENVMINPHPSTCCGFKGTWGVSE